MKKITALIMAVLLAVLSLVACSSKTPAAADPVTDPAGNVIHATEPKTDPVTEPVQYTEGLAFELSEKRTSYIVTGLGTAKGTADGRLDIVIPETYDGLPVTAIKKEAFSDEFITGIVIPNSITSIGRSAFEGCSSLTSVEIPDSVVFIGFWAFYECSSLEKVVVKNPFVCISANVFGKSNSNLKLHGHTGSSVENYASSYEHAFVSVGEIPGDSVVDSGTCGASLEWILYKDARLVISGTGAMEWSSSAGSPWGMYCSFIKTVDINEGVTNIGEGAFADFTSLKSIEIPKSVTSIENWAFFDCAELNSLTVLNDSTQISDSAFGNCSNLKDIDFDGHIEINFYVSAVD